MENSLNQSKNLFVEIHVGMCVINFANRILQNCAIWQIVFNTEKHLMKIFFSFMTEKKIKTNLLKLKLFI